MANRDVLLPHVAWVEYSHIVAGDMVIFTTAEVVIGECREAVFTRPHDSKTGFDELKVEKRVWTDHGHLTCCVHLIISDNIEYIVLSTIDNIE